MKRLKNRRQAPPNGFLYTQRETGWQNWKVEPASQWDFYLCARAIQAHRKANPQFRLSTSLPAIEEELDVVTSTRIAAMPGTESYLMEAGSAQPSFTAAPTQTLRAAVAAVKQVNAGAENIADWLDSEIPPVSSEISERRAATCVKCLLNGMGSLSRWFTIPAAALITRRLEKLHARKLSTSLDNQLGTCEACLCRNQLKVHEPIELVLKHTSEEIKAKLDKNCWVLSESALLERLEK